MLDWLRISLSSDEISWATELCSLAEVEICTLRSLISCAECAMACTSLPTSLTNWLLVCAWLTVCSVSLAMFWLSTCSFSIMD
ncbi:Uncharacterised protein [Vibrio cholerae]|nr:Uncharacterised protein [Vibrio cholerae]